MECVEWWRVMPTGPASEAQAVVYGSRSALSKRASAAQLPSESSCGNVGPRVASYSGLSVEVLNPDFYVISA